MTLYRIDVDKALFNWMAKNEQRMTYTELAKKAQVSISSLHRLRTTPVVRPDLNTLEKLANALECDPFELIRREEVPEVSQKR
ncbi:MAG: helix-turn-helix transcriptional regulator [Chloroflexi bacterium]|nr:helix-turn-helix transcriptional regulator [Chloroflexota bacterium]